MKSDNIPSHPRVYGRRQGRPLRVRKTFLMQDLLPKIQITLREGVSTISKKDGVVPLPSRERLGEGAIGNTNAGFNVMPPPPTPPARGGESVRYCFDPVSLFPSKPKDIWLEIGFGGGEHIAAQAMKHPQNGFIGCEPFVNGVASLLDHVEREGITNIRVYPNDARVLMDALPDGSIARCHVLFPDPWPKARHAERRFIGPENIERLARLLRKGALLDLASDDPRLQAWMKKCMAEAEDFEQIHAAKEPPEDWVSTRYEQKAYKAKRQPIYWRFVRK